MHIFSKEYMIDSEILYEAHTPVTVFWFVQYFSSHVYSQNCDW